MKNILDIISNGEGLTVEFKKSREKVTSDVYQSICAFLNRNGGQVFLGVEDDGAITGIKEDALEGMKKDLVTALNNSQKLNPPLYILFTKAYSGADPQLMEDDIFRIIIPLIEQVTEQVNRRRKIIEFCKTPRATFEIMDHLGLKHREYFRSKILQPLLAEGILAQTMPDTPKSPNQKYYSKRPDELDKNDYQ